MSILKQLSAAALALSLVGVAFAEPCRYVDDGACDEPAGCTFGTDEADCASACALDAPPPTAFGACRFRAGESAQDPTPSADLEARGTWGEGGPYGWSYHRVDALSERDDESEVERVYTVYVPDRYDPATPAPIVMYGGGFGDDVHKAAYTDLTRLAELEGFIVVYTQQLYRDFGPRGYRHAWYVYNQAFRGDWDVVPDLDFYLRVIAQMQAKYNIDRSRVITTGTSRGAGISVMLGFLAPDVFSGYVSQAGFAGVNEFDAFIDLYAGRQVPSVIVHGLVDNNVAPEEGLNLAAQLEGLGWVEGEDLLTYFLDDVGHQWQPQLSQRWYDFLYDRPIPLEDVRDLTDYGAPKPL